MRKYNLIIAMILSFFNRNSFGNELLISHDQIIFNPIKYAQKEITFNVEILGLVDELNELKSYGKLTNLNFDIKINKLRKMEITINGISNQFNDLNKNLKAKLTPIIELLFPASLNNFYRGYKLENKNNYVSATDLSYEKPIRESYMTFDKNSALIENKIKTVQGTQIINFTYANGPSGFKELLLEKIDRKIIYGPTHLLSNSTIKYEYVNSKPVPTEFKTEFIFENKENNTNNERVGKLVEVFKITNFKYN